LIADIRTNEAHTRSVDYIVLGDMLSKLHLHVK